MNDIDMVFFSIVNGAILLLNIFLYRCAVRLNIDMNNRMDKFVRKIWSAEVAEEFLEMEVKSQKS